MNTQFRSLVGVIAAAALLLCGASQVEAQEVKVEFDLPVQPLADALRAVGKRTDTNILIDRRLVGDRKAPALKAQLTIDEALKRLLAGSGLDYRYVDEQTVVVAQPGSDVAASSSAATGADGAANEPAAHDARSTLRLVRVDDTWTQVVQQVVGNSAAEETPAPEAPPTDEKGEGAEIFVTGSRIRGMAGQATANPVYIFTSQDFERSGLTSLGEFRNMIPQLGVTSGVGGTGLTGGNVSFATQALVDFDLRGLGRGTTLVLVNGRRMARGGQSIGVDAFNPDGIPLSMVERIEVLSAGASALYGADAMGGVINIILKEDYAGSEAQVSYENTFDHDVGVRNVSARTAYRAGAFSIIASATWRDNNEQKLSDRWFTRAENRGNFMSSNLDIIGGSGSVSVRTGVLPGLATRIAAVPGNADGGPLILENYQTAGPLAPRFDLSPLISIINPAVRRNAMLRTTYGFGPAAEVFMDVSWSEAVTRFIDRPVRASNLNIPAGYPGNPFGVTVQLNKIFFDLPRSVRQSTNRNTGVTLGLQGGLAHAWRYELSGNWARAHLLDEYPNGLGTGFDLARLTAAMNNPDPALRPTLIYDSRAGNPNPPGLLESLTTNSPFDDISSSFNYLLQFTGPVFNLRAGAVAVAVGAEYRLDKVDFLRSPDPFFLQVNPDRSVRSVFAEVQVPLISDRNAVPLVHQLDLNLAGRLDDHNDVGRAETPRLGLLYRPVKWLAIRASRGEGFKAPLLYQLYSPSNPQEGWLTFFPVVDPVRGEPVDDSVIVTLGGNRDLRPERSVTYNYGLLFDIPFVDGLSLSVDFYDIDYQDKIEDLSFTPQQLVDSFPERLTRAPPVGGIPGAITAMDATAVNTAATRTRGYDLQLNYSRATDWGTFGMKAGMSKPQRYEYQVTPFDPPAQLMFPRRASGNMTWSRQALDLSLAALYQAKYRINPTQSYIAPSKMEWTPTIAYDFGRDERFGAVQSSWLARVLADTRITLSIANVFNSEPTVEEAATSFSTVYDPRLRRYALTIRRQF